MQREIVKIDNTMQAIVYRPDAAIIEGVILFFHGLGEIASNGGIDIIERNDPLRQMAYIDAETRRVKTGIEIPYIVVAPQLNGISWGKNQILSILDFIDSLGLSNVHVTGLSLGGMAVYSAVKFASEYRHKGYFKTAGAVCGRTSTSNLDAFENVALKIWHADNDPTVSVGPDRTLYQKLKERGYDVEYKEYDGKGHAIWDEAYNTTDPDSYWKWLERKTAVNEISLPEPVQLFDVQNGELFANTATRKYKVNATLTEV